MKMILLLLVLNLARDTIKVMTLFEELNEKGYVLFFNQGERYTEKFIAPEDRPNFFWYHDAFYSHFSIINQERYLHIFVKKRDEIHCTFMQGIKSWAEADAYFLENKKKQINNLGDGMGKASLALNPPILRSPDTLTPDLIIDFEEDGNFDGKIIFPGNFNGVSCKFFDNQHIPIDFNQIPDLMNIIRNIAK